MAVFPRYRIASVQQTLLVLLVQGVDVDVRGWFSQTGSLDIRDILPVSGHQLSLHRFRQWQAVCLPP